jgi:hypothetical protein
MKRFSSNITCLSPVMKKTSPTKLNQEKVKEGAKQEQPWIVQGVKKNYKQQQNTKNSKYKQQLLTNKTYSSAVSSMRHPLYLPKGERERDQEPVAATAAATANIKLSMLMIVDVVRRHRRSIMPPLARIGASTKRLEQQQLL